MNTSFFFLLLLHLLYPHPFQNYIATLGYTGLWVQGFNTLQNEMGILLPFPALFLWEITLGTLIEQQEFKLHLCWLMPCKQHTTHTHKCTHWAHPCKHWRHTHTQPFYCRMLKLNHSLPLFLSSSFIIVLPCGISSVFVLSHYITFSLLSFKHCIYSAIRDASFFSFRVTLIIPILCWGVLHPLLKLDNKKQCALPRESTSQNPFDQCLKDTCWDQLEGCLRSGCIANSLLFYEKVKETWESDTDGPNSITRNVLWVGFLSACFLRVVTVLIIYRYRPLKGKILLRQTFSFSRALDTTDQNPFYHIINPFSFYFPKQL